MGNRICLLEDDQAIKEIVEMILADEQYEVTGVSTVKEFLALKNKDSQDLYILDVRLPDGNGLNVCNLLKSEDETRDIPVIMMSAHACLNAITNSCQAQSFMAKPFDIFELLKVVGQQIGRA